MFLTIITFIIVLSILVSAHELGHFWVARSFGVKAEEFGLGFPPRGIGFQTWRESRMKKVAETEIVTVHTEEGITASGEPVIKQTIFDKIKEFGLMIIERKYRIIRGNRPLREDEEKYGTVYSLNWIPLGGFVKIKGENGECESEKDSFACKSAWQRFCILFAGVSMNVILAAVLISVGLMVGMPRMIEGAGKHAQISDVKIQVAEVIQDSPAEKAGLKIGDIILKIDNKQFEQEDVLQKYVDENSGRELSYQLSRGGEEKIIKVVPEKRAETGKGGIGIAIVSTGIIKYPWYIAIYEGIKTSILLVWAIILAFYGLIKNIILGNGVGGDITGPVGIATMTGQAARMGWVYVLQFTALLSVNLAVINFLPFPALDGGRILFIIVEKIKGKPVKREVEAVMHYIGFALLLLLIAVVTFRDVLKIWTQ